MARAHDADDGHRRARGTDRVVRASRLPTQRRVPAVSVWRSALRDSEAGRPALRMARQGFIVSCLDGTPFLSLWVGRKAAKPDARCWASPDKSRVGPPYGGSMS